MKDFIVVSHLERGTRQVASNTPNPKAENRKEHFLLIITKTNTHTHTPHKDTDKEGYQTLSSSSGSLCASSELCTLLTDSVSPLSDSVLAGSWLLYHEFINLRQAKKKLESGQKGGEEVSHRRSLRPIPLIPRVFFFLGGGTHDLYSGLFTPSSR